MIRSVLLLCISLVVATVGPSLMASIPPTPLETDLGGCIGSSTYPCIPVYVPPDDGPGAGCPKEVIDLDTCLASCECEYERRRSECGNDSRCQFVASAQRDQCGGGCRDTYPR